MHQLLGRRVRSGSGGEERRRLLVPGSEQFSHSFMMASQDSLGTRHLSALPYYYIHFCGTAGPKCLALWGSPILVGEGMHSRGTEASRMSIRGSKRKDIWASTSNAVVGRMAGRPACFTSTLHLA